MRVVIVLILLLPTLAYAEALQIDGPAGPLEAELLSVPHAETIVVIVPGSGPIDRDGNGAQAGLSTDTYRLLAEGLGREGIASLRIDKRGFFGSAGAVSDPNDVTISEYATDVRNWVAEAAKLASCVWIAGHSEGGLVALVAAQQRLAGLCGVILMAAPGRPLGQLMIEQFRANPANAPLMPELEAIIQSLEAGEIYPPDDVNPILRPLFSAGLQRYMIDLFSYDPVQSAASWEGPALILQGDADLQVGRHDAELLHGVMAQARLVMLGNGTHMLKSDVAGDPFATYRDAALPLHPDLVKAIAEFMSNAE